MNQRTLPQHLPRFLLLFALGILGCSEADPGPDPDLLHGPDGRSILLRGVNARVEGLFDVTFSDGRTALEEIPRFTLEDAKRMRQLGFTVLRLPINWSGLEPMDGQISQGYLNQLAEILRLCKQVGLGVVVDMHQDAYSKEIGEDGAPLWAIKPPPDKLLQGPLLDLEERRLSGQVLRAFKGFFEENRDGLQERFTEAFATLAMRFATDEAVLGFELFNEPIASKEALWAFHNKVANRLRQVTQKPIYFEPAVIRNQTDQAPYADVPFPVTGVYAPHVYTLSFGDPKGELKTLSYERLAGSIRAAKEEARSWRTPLFIGEWGIDPKHESALRYVGFALDAHDEVLASSALWLWKENSQGSWGLFDYVGQAFVERPAFIQAVSRPYVQIAGGDLKKMHFDRDTIAHL